MRTLLRSFLIIMAIAALAGTALADLPGDTSDPQATPPPSPAAPQPKPPAAGPIQIKVNDTVNFRFGLLLQPQVDFQENASEQTGENLMLRRVRFIVGGQMAKNIYFFFQTENSRLGGAIGTGAQAISTGFQTN